jgi:hypothetical protein
MRAIVLCMCVCVVCSTAVILWGRRPAAILRRQQHLLIKNANDKTQKKLNFYLAKNTGK